MDTDMYHQREGAKKVLRMQARTLAELEASLGAVETNSDYTRGYQEGMLVVIQSIRDVNTRLVRSLDD